MDDFSDLGVATAFVDTSVDLGDAVHDWESRVIERGRQKGREEGKNRAFSEGHKDGWGKGVDLGLEFGFYFGVIARLREVQRSGSEATPTLLTEEEAKQASPRAIELSTLQNKILLPRVIESCESLEALLAAFPETPDFESEDVFAQLLKIRSKFKVLETRLGSVLEIMPNLDGSATVKVSTDF
mmetsp:Transcript_16717/g.29594  ORF Transcript_16717/g.29594 Transcript_16717/m.29594 type:complete len:184 (-) Transcript_16717:170-721(-)